MTHVVTSRGGRATWWLAVGIFLVVTALFCAVRTAAADPVGDLQTQARAIAEKLNALQHQAEVASERANGADYQLSQLEIQIVAARARADQASAAAALNADLVSDFAVRAYVGQDGSDGMGELFQSSADGAGTRLGYSRAVFGDRQQLVDDLDASQGVADDAVRELQADESAAKAAAEQAKSERSRLLQLVDQQQQVQAQVQGQLVQAVADQQSAIEARAEQQAAAAPGAPVVDSPGAQPARPAGTTGAVPAASHDPVSAPTTTPRQTPTTGPRPAPPPPKPAPGPAPPAPSGAATAVAAAKSQVGKPYVWGGASPSSGFDCSGLTSWAWARAGVSLPHFAQAQYDLTRRISASALHPGDLVFYADATGYVYHVAMYIGGGQVVQALNEKYGVMIGSLYSAGSAPYGYGRV